MTETSLRLTDQTSNFPFSPYPLIRRFQAECLAPFKSISPAKPQIFQSHPLFVSGRTSCYIDQDRNQFKREQLGFNQAVISEIIVREIVSELLPDDLLIRHTPSSLDISGQYGISKGGDILVATAVPFKDEEYYDAECLIDATVSGEQGTSYIVKKAKSPINYDLGCPVFVVSIKNYPYYDKKGRNIGIHGYMDKINKLLLADRYEELWTESDYVWNDWIGRTAKQIEDGIEECYVRLEQLYPQEGYEDDDHAAILYTRLTGKLAWFGDILQQV